MAKKIDKILLIKLIRHVSEISLRQAHDIATVLEELNIVDIERGATITFPPKSLKTA